MFVVGLCLLFIKVPPIQTISIHWPEHDLWSNNLSPMGLGRRSIFKKIKFIKSRLCARTFSPLKLIVLKSMVALLAF
jgi:hypothetical protein